MLTHTALTHTYSIYVVYVTIMFNATAIQLVRITINYIHHINIYTYIQRNPDSLQLHCNRVLLLTRPTYNNIHTLL